MPPRSRRSLTRDAHEELDRLSGQRRYRAVLRCDNATEPACAAMNEGAGERVGLAFIPAG